VAKFKHACVGRTLTKQNSVHKEIKNRLKRQREQTQSCNFSCFLCGRETWSPTL